MVELSAPTTVVIHFPTERRTLPFRDRLWNKRPTYSVAGFFVSQPSSCPSGRPLVNLEARYLPKPKGFYFAQRGRVPSTSSVGVPD